MLDGSSSASSQQQSQSSPSPTGQLPPANPPASSTRVNSSSPARSIPPHMILEGAATGRSPTPELTGTGGSSPSAACAGLTLDGESSSEKASAGPLAIRDIKSRTNLSDRSSSPAAKRTAAAMEDTPIKDEDVDVVMDIKVEAEEDSVNTSEPSLSPHSTNLTQQSHGNRHKGELSVDALAYGASPIKESDSKSEEMPFLVTVNGSQNLGISTSSNPAPDAMITTASGLPPTSTTTHDSIPSIDEQIEQVMQLAQRPMEAGQKGFVISAKWLARVLSRGSNPRDGTDRFGKEARIGTIGPVDNTGLNLIVDPSMGNFRDEAGDPFVPLKPGLQMSEDFEILPKEAWNLTIKWYGLQAGSNIITRYCHNTSTNETRENLQFELHPPVFTILKLPDTSGGMTTNTLKEKDLMPIKLLASRHERFNSFLKRVKELGNIPLKTKVRIWRILGGLGRNAQTGMLTPAQSRSTSPSPTFVPPVDPGDRLVMDVNTFVNLQLGSQRELVEANDETANEKYNGHATLDLIGLRQDEVIVVEEQIGGPAGGEWVSDAVGRQAKTNGIAISVTKAGSTVVRDTLKPGAAKVASSGRISPALGGMMTRGRQQKNGRTRGTAGLSNLGNTCYMNSALQCIRSVEELTQYFLMDKYKKDLNPTNPLSHNGHVAKAYAGLLSEMYSPNASFSFAPRNFKNIIGKYGPSFSGYQQQDSQEFLLFLIDGLQEDLSRIHLKPYIEKPDSTDEMVNNPAALRELADKCWDIYKARNDSVITDLFAGMYKSTVICPVCGKVSIIFDPFNNLTLQLPVENVWSRTVYFMPLHSRLVTIGVDIDKNASFVALKEYVAAKVGTDPKRLIVAEIYKSRIYKVFDDKKSIVDERIGEKDTIAVFELEDRPSNYPPPKKKVPRFKMAYSNNSDEEEDIPEGDSPLADKMLVPVFHRHTKQDSHPRHTLREVFGYPAYIIITREEAKDYDAILQKILAKIDTMTTASILKDEGGPDSTPEDSDGVLMSTEDVDSSASDSRIQTKSLEGEEGVIDISMRDAGDVSRESSGGPKNLPVSKYKSLPRVLRPGEFIPPRLRTLFDIKYFTANQEMVPTGWATLQDESKDYPKIEARRPIADFGRRRDTKGKLARRIQRLDSASSSDADDDVPDVGGFSAQNQTSYDSDSDNGLPPVEEVTQAPIGLARFNKTTHRDGNGQLSYSRKGKNKAQYNDYDDSEAEAEPPALIRLGEAIVLDWNTEAYELLFTATETNQEGHAAPTWETIPAISDPELEAKRRQRANRKRNGISLEDCLDEFNKAEVLSEADAWYCPRCKEHRRASKKFELWKAPDILVIHLKRFSRNLRDKLEILVDFPVEGLDLSSRVAMREDGKSLTYDLFAVDNHYGGLAGGHYTAFAKNFYDNNWYEYNDSSVSRRGNPSVVVTTAAYLLFYRRRSFQPLGGPFFEKIVNAANSPSQSQSGSRTTSPSGEGKRLEDSPPFRSGFSSALTQVGAIHQAGGGGLEVARTAAPMRTGVDDDLPSYSSSVGNIGDRAAEALQSMEVDEEDEGIADTGDRFRNTVLPAVGWSFANLESISAQPGSDPEDEAIYDDDSTKAVSPTSDSDRNIDDYIDDNEGQGDERRLPTLIQDEGTTSGAFGSYRSGSTPVQDTPPLIESYDDPAVAEVRVVEGDEMFTSQD